MTKKKKTEVIEMLRRVKARILKHPEKYDQGSWCGTACCIAGHIALDQGAKLKITRDEYGEYGNFTLDGKPIRAEDFGKNALGLEYMPWLFHGEWEDCGDTKPGVLEIKSGDSPQVQAAKAAVAIETYISELG